MSFLSKASRVYRAVVFGGGLGGATLGIRHEIQNPFPEKIETIEDFGVKTICMTSSILVCGSLGILTGALSPIIIPVGMFCYAINR